MFAFFNSAAVFPLPWYAPFVAAMIAVTGTTGSNSSGGFASGDDRGDANSWNESLANSAGDSSTWTESESESETESSVLIPVFGKELSHVQFRSLEEQLFRSMAMLFDQKERCGVARMVGMNAPVSIMTPEVVKMPSSQERTKRFLERHYGKLPFALTSGQAEKQIKERAEKFADELFKEAADDISTAKRRITKST